MFNFIPMKYRSRVLLAPQTTASAAQAYLAPTPGVKGINIRAVVKKGDATNLVLSLNYADADDTTGASATAFPVDVDIYKDGVRQTAANDFTIEDASGDFIVDFCIDPATIPEGKLVGLAYAASNVGNLVAAEMIEDVAYRPTAS